VLTVVDLFGFEKMWERKVSSSPDKVIRKLQLMKLDLCVTWKYRTYKEESYLLNKTGIVYSMTY